MECDPPLDPHIDCRYFSIGPSAVVEHIGGKPYPRAAFDPLGGESQMSAYSYEAVFDSANDIDAVELSRQFDDDVPDELTRAVPGDAPSAIKIYHRRVTGRKVVRLRGAPGGEDERVLSQQ